MVAQIKKDEVAEVAPPSYPAGEENGLSGVGCA
jgi:hypothetical protein